jgi:hypothetical protein
VHADRARPSFFIAIASRGRRARNLSRRAP